MLRSDWRVLIFFSIVICAGCLYEHAELQPPPMPTYCELDSLYHFQKSYVVEMDVYKWNTGQGITFDSVVNIPLSLWTIDTNNIIVETVYFSYDLELAILTDSTYIFSDPDPSHPLSHAYVRFNCLSDSCSIDFRSGALGYLNWYQTRFKYR